MGASTVFRIIGYFSSLIALLIIGFYFMGSGGEPVIGLWFIGVLGILGTIVGAGTGEILLDETLNDYKNSNKKPIQKNRNKK